MNENYNIVLNSLKKKIDIVVSKYEEANAINIELAQIVEKYREQIDANNNKIKELEEKIDKLQLVQAFKISTGDVKEAKQSINKMIRGIDKCIGQIMTD